MGGLKVISSFCTSDFEFRDILASEGLKEFWHAGIDDSLVSLETGFVIEPSYRNVNFQLI